MVKESIPGRMVEDMRVNTLTIAKMDTVPIFGLMEDNTEVTGKTENSMEKDFTNQLTVKKRKDSGKRVRELDGSKNEYIKRVKTKL